MPLFIYENCKNKKSWQHILAELWEKQTHLHWWWNASWYNSYGEELGNAEKNNHIWTYLLIELSPHLDIYPNDTPPTIWKYTCTRLFIASLLVMTVTHKRVDELCNKLTQWSTMQVLKKSKSLWTKRAKYRRESIVS